MTVIIIHKPFNKQINVKVTKKFIDYITNEPLVFEVFGHFTKHPLHADSQIGSMFVLFNSFLLLKHFEYYFLLIIHPTVYKNDQTKFIYLILLYSKLRTT